MSWLHDSWTWSFYWQGCTTESCSVFLRWIPPQSQVLPNRLVVHKCNPWVPFCESWTPLHLWQQVLTDIGKMPALSKNIGLDVVLSIFSLPQGPVASTTSVLSALSPGPGLAVFFQRPPSKIWKWLASEPFLLMGGELQLMIAGVFWHSVPRQQHVFFLSPHHFFLSTHQFNYSSGSPGTDLPSPLLHSL